MREILSHQKNKIIFLSVLIVLSLFAFLRSSSIYTTIVDDSYIFFRFADNIAGGYGIVWNIGENVVEGYSSFLYLILLLIAKLLSFNLEVFSIITGIICTSLHLYIAYLIYEQFYPSLTKENIFTVIMLLLSPAYIYWSAAGMETCFYSMFLLLCIYSFLNLPQTSGYLLLLGSLFGVLCLIRFEATLFFIFTFFYIAFNSSSKYKIWLSKNALLFCLGFIIIFAPYFLWRWNYFGYFLPNTFYDKTGGGIDQVIGGFLYSLRSIRLFYGLFWIFIAVVAINFKFKMLHKKARYVVGVGVVSVFTTIIIGGDHFSYSRFFIPVFPLLFVFFPPALNKFFNLKIFHLYKPVYKIGFAFFLFIVIMLFKLPYHEMLQGIENLFSGEKEIVVFYDTNVGEKVIDWEHGFALMANVLNDIADTNESIAAIPVGIIGYLSKMKIIDMVGVVDPVIAHQEFDQQYLSQWIPGHNKGDGKYILSRKPDYIQLTDYITHKPRREPGQRSLQFKSINEIWMSEDFHKNYKFRYVEVAEGWYYNFYERIN